MPGPMSRLRKYLVAGLLVWVPLGVTVLVVKVLIDLMDRVLLVLPDALHPEALVGFRIPGLGLLLSLIVLLGTGVVVANFFGRRLVAFWEALLARIPLVRTVYGAAKQVAETLFADKGASFRKVLLIQYPRKGIWALAFYTGTTVGEVQQKTEKEVVNVFLPTTPNPTSGFLIMVPREDVIELDMPVEEGIKLIMTLGVFTPSDFRKPVGSVEPVPDTIAAPPEEAKLRDAGK